MPNIDQARALATLISLLLKTGDVTKWVAQPSTDRDYIHIRGLRGLAWAWGTVLITPRRFFQTAVSPGDQRAAIQFVGLITFCLVTGRLLTDPPSVFGYSRIASSTHSIILTALILIGAACILIAPLVLHLAAAVATLTLHPLVSSRSGVSETVQVLAYAAAPGVFVAIPSPLVQLISTSYGAFLLILGLAIIHKTTLVRATFAGFLPVVFIFGWILGGLDAFTAVTGI